MISEKRSAAARANGARSRGPVTAEGKSIASRNALRHGLLSHIIVLPNESAEMFHQLFNLTLERFSPVDEVEMSLIEEMVASYWRLRRCMAIETSLLANSLDQWPDMGAIAQVAEAFRDPANIQHLDRLERYQVRLQNAYHRALRGIAHMRKTANRPAPLTPEATANMRNEPKEPNVCNTDPEPGQRPAPVLEPQLSSRRALPLEPSVFP
ncbi:MAG: hypothetical protein ABI806_18200 [Candidatus Solibacter sp.]